MYKQTLLYSQKNKKTDLHVWAHTDQKGNLHIEGHDLGTDLPKLFGPDITEYEWVETINKKYFNQLHKILNGKKTDSILKLIKDNFSGDNVFKITSFLKKNNIPYDFWNRMGD